MGYWHTGVPNGGEPLGWLGRLADDTLRRVDAQPDREPRAARSRSRCGAGRHSPLVFDDPARFRRDGTDNEKQVLAELSQPRDDDESDARVSRRPRRENATESSDFVAPGVGVYRTTSGLRAGGGFGGNLQRVAALIAAGMPTRLFYVTYQGNSFDTHVQQADLHSRLLMSPPTRCAGSSTTSSASGAPTRSRS